MILIFLIYFTIDLTEEKNEHPIELMHKNICYMVIICNWNKNTLQIHIFNHYIIIFPFYMIDEYELYLKDVKKNIRKIYLKNINYILNIQY